MSVNAYYWTLSVYLSGLTGSKIPDSGFRDDHKLLAADPGQMDTHPVINQMSIRYFPALTRFTIKNNSTMYLKVCSFLNQ